MIITEYYFADQNSSTIGYDIFCQTNEIS